LNHRLEKNKNVGGKIEMMQTNNGRRRGFERWVAIFGGNGERKG